MKKITAALLLLAAGTDIASAQNIVLNELMQSNIDYLMVDKDFPDSWVELYNPSASKVTLTGYRIGEKNIYDKAYRLPANTTIEPNGHLLIYCDKENRGLHTDFRIDSGKASLYLFDGTGQPVDSIIMPAMPAANVAYGRTSDAADTWQYEVTPTAGTANTGVFTDQLLPEPVFSVKGGVLSGTGVTMLTVSLPDNPDLPADTKVYMTVDGTEPTLLSRSSKSFTINISDTRVVRAKLMSSQALSRRSTTQSYIVHPRELTLPVVSIVTDRDYLYSGDIGIISGTVNDGKPNYMQKWRRPLNIEYFAPGQYDSQVFNQLCETAISGVSTREQPQKSMKIYANKRFGKKTFKGNFWEMKPEVGKVKSFTLRSGGNNSFTTRINDAAVQTLFGQNTDDVDYQAYQPVIVYINGTYAGEFGMRERSNEDFVEANYDIEDVEIADEASYQKPTKGTLFETFYKSYHDPSVTYGELESQMDIDNFTATLAAEFYAMNTDWPTNNVSLWRPTEEGGKWRWILKDLDRAGMNLALYPSTFDMFRYVFQPDDIMYGGINNFDLYVTMSRFPEFNDKFTDLLTVQLGDFLKADSMTVLLDTMTAQIQTELKPTFYAYNCIDEWAAFKSNMKNLKRFFTERPANIYDQMSRFYSFGKTVPTTVDNPDGTVSINGIPLRTAAFDGSCFTGRAFTLDTGSDRKGWTLTLTHRDGTTQTEEFLTQQFTFTLADYLRDDNDRLTAAFTLVDIPEETPDENPETVSISSLANTAASAAYNLRGIRTGKTGKGVVIRGGKKELLK